MINDEEHLVADIVIIPPAFLEITEMFLFLHQKMKI